MEKVRLGRTEMMVTRLGFGGIPIQRVSEEEAIAVVHKCLEVDINYLDTANGYTTSEERIGKAIRGKREKLFLSTKSLARNREDVEKHLKLSLERLGTDYIDLYQLHNVSNAKALETVIDPNGPRAAVEEAKRAGLVKHIGITCHQIDIAKDAVKTDLFETIMFPLNFMSYEGRDELLSLCRQHDVGFIAMKPLAGGMIDNATIAIKYLLQFPDIVLIPGIERVPEIEEIARVFEGPKEMTAGEKQEMERIKQELGPRFCRRCDYCQPCTAEIPISDIMSFPNLRKRLPLVRLYTGKFAEAFTKALECTDCGECEERCPYNLPIRDMMKEHIKMHQAGKLEYEKQLASGQ
jgi:predicted aldo/keto reductase-like oxidoreductase